MNIIKLKILNKIELLCLFVIYAILFLNAYCTKDSIVALISAFCGITYTVLAGKGNPICYFFGLCGSVFYCYLSLKNALWGNLFLYLAYYIPMQILGFFQWRKNLKKDSLEIIKRVLSSKEKIIIFLITTIVTIFAIYLLFYLKDNSPIIDGITTVFSVVGMYLTVKRCIEQWQIWIIVNGLSFFMWLQIAINGAKVYSTVIMWGAYFILAIYFHKKWKNDIS